jgi:outer membrane protein insertion porin family
MAPKRACRFRMTSFTWIRIGVLFCLYGLVTAGAQNSPNPPANPPAAQPQPTRLASNVIEAIEFRGARRIPGDILRTIIVSKAGDVYDEAAVRRDFTALWNTGRFDDIQVRTETGERGGVVVRFMVTERPL